MTSAAQTALVILDDGLRMIERHRHQPIPSTICAAKVARGGWSACAAHPAIPRASGRVLRRAGAVLWAQHVARRRPRPLAMFSMPGPRRRLTGTIFSWLSLWLSHTLSKLWVLPARTSWAVQDLNLWPLPCQGRSAGCWLALDSARQGACLRLPSVDMACCGLAAAVDGYQNG